MKQFQKDKLIVKIYDTRAAAGAAAAREIGETIRALLCEKDELNIVFAAAPSQNETLAALVADGGIEWERINAFHMDEYIGLPKDAPQGFGNFLAERLFGKVPFRSVNRLNGAAPDPSKEAKRYEALLKSHAPDLVVMGIGENGHIAFNDPAVADFHDPLGVKIVGLDEVCRMQQVHDGCFSALCDVPQHALTLTVPMLVSAPHLFCIVPAATKASAVRECLTGEIGEHCPASILRTCGHATLYLDGDSASLL